MERLISSSSLASGGSITKPSPIASGALSNVFHLSGAAARTGILLRRRPGFSPTVALFSKCNETHHPHSLHSFSRISNTAPLSEGKGKLIYSFIQPAAGRELPVPFVRKVVFPPCSVFLSTVIVTLIQTIFPHPIYATVQSNTKTAFGLVRAEFLSSAWTGFFTGCLHTLSSPDHLAVLAPLSIGRTRIESAIVGALWGCGHDAGQMIFGVFFLLFKDRLRIEIIRTWGTRIVGITLLIIGAMGIKEASEVEAPCVDLETGGFDVRMSETLDRASGGKKKIGFATFATGIVHGLQPDALMMILPALALPSRLAGAAYLGMFLVGTIFSMGAYTVFIGSCSQALKERVPRITEKLTWAASLVAIFMGVTILLSQAFGFILY